MLMRKRVKKEYAAWANMKTRCSNPKAHKYHLYGGRGIEVCERWRNSFDAFYEDVGPAPSAKHTLDRINTDGNYEPANVRWATWSTQNRNRRRGRMPQSPEELAILSRLLSRRKKPPLTQRNWEED